MRVASFDPHVMPIVARGDAADAIPSAALTPQALRAAFVDPLPWEAQLGDPQFGKVRLGDYPGAYAAGGVVDAAVLIALLKRPEGISVLFTERTAHLNDHAGQISLPGGRAEPEDTTLESTALREAEEEVGLPARAVEIIGRLPEYRTVTGYAVTPVVGLVDPPSTWTADRFEVAHIFEVPLAFLMNPHHHETRRVALETPPAAPSAPPRQFIAMPWRDTDGRRQFIWGATAGMLRNFYLHLHAQLQRA